MNLHPTLGLGLKFCVTNPQAPLKATDTITRLRKDVQRKIFFRYQEKDSQDEYIPKLHIPSSWEVDIFHQNQQANELINLFKTAIETARRNKPRRRRNNLTTFQQKTLAFLKDNPEFVVFMCDKNFGPAVIERWQYIERALKDHLMKPNLYKKLSFYEMKYLLHQQHDQLREWVADNTHCLSKPERTFFKRAFKWFKQRVQQFYITAKVHKTPWATRPVVGTCGSNLAQLSKWHDWKLQAIARKSPTYISGSETVRQKLQGLRWQKNTVVFTADARSMYTMINIDHALEVIAKYLRRYHPEVTMINGIIEALGIVMRQNYFQFGSSFFHQLDGTAMGTPVACVFATLYFAWHERTFLLPKWRQFLQFYCRFIDDAFIICTLKKSQIEEFRTDMKFKYLEWDTFQVDDKEVDFLDITVYENNGGFATKSFEKTLNLHLYIAQH